MSKQLLSRNEVAARNGVCVRTICNEISRGRLAAVKLGRRTMITLEAERLWRDAMPAFRCKWEGQQDVVR